MVGPKHIVSTASEGGKYNQGPTCGNGDPRIAKPLCEPSMVEQLMDIALSFPRLSVRCFSVVNSYAEPLEIVGMSRVIREAEDRLRLHAGGLSLTRIAWAYWVHQRPDGCDVHIIAMPLDLLSGLILPLHARDETICGLTEKTFRLWDLQHGRASPEDWWRRDLVTPAPEGLSVEETKWFVETDIYIVDWLRAGKIRNRDDVITALEEAGARFAETESKFFTHLIFTHGQQKYIIYGGKYSQKFTFNTVSGSAGRFPERNPADRAAEIARLVSEIDQLRVSRGEVYRRFDRFQNIPETRGVSPKLERHLLRDVGNLERVARETDGIHSPGVSGFPQVDGRYSGHVGESGLGDHPLASSHDRVLGGSQNHSGTAGETFHCGRNPTAGPSASDGNAAGSSGRGDQEIEGGGARKSASQPSLRPGRVDLGPGKFRPATGERPTSGPVSGSSAQSVNSEPEHTIWYDHYIACETELNTHEQRRTERKRLIAEIIASLAEGAARAAASLRRVAEILDGIAHGFRARTARPAAGDRAPSGQDRAGHPESRLPVDLPRGGKASVGARLAARIGELCATRQKCAETLTTVDQLTPRDAGSRPKAKAARPSRAAEVPL